MTGLRGLPRRVWNACNYDEMKLLAMVLERRVDPDDRPVLIDVGAHYGSSCSPFLEKGWKVVALEPDADNRSKLEMLADRFPTRLTIVPKAASEAEGVASFFSSTTSTGISSLHSFHETHEESAQIETVPLRTVVYEQGLTSVAILKIDVEGHEMTVLRSMDWSILPEVVVCEFDEAKALQDGPTQDAIRSLLADVGYEHVTVSEWFPVVEYGQHHRPRRLSDSTSALSAGAWGNVLAFSSELDQQSFEDRARPLVTRARAAQPLTKQISRVNRVIRDLV